MLGTLMKEVQMSNFRLVGLALLLMTAGSQLLNGMTREHKEKYKKMRAEQAAAGMIKGGKPLSSGKSSAGSMSGAATTGSALPLGGLTDLSDEYGEDDSSVKLLMDEAAGSALLDGDPRTEEEKAAELEEAAEVRRFNEARDARILDSALTDVFRSDSDESTPAGSSMTPVSARLQHLSLIGSSNNGLGRPVLSSAPVGDDLVARLEREEQEGRARAAAIEAAKADFQRSLAVARRSASEETEEADAAVRRVRELEAAEPAAVSAALPPVNAAADLNFD
jgi:hypothetical protein